MLPVQLNVSLASSVLTAVIMLHTQSSSAILEGCGYVYFVNGAWFSPQISDVTCEGNIFFSVFVMILHFMSPKWDSNTLSGGLVLFTLTFYNPVTHSRFNYHLWLAWVSLIIISKQCWPGHFFIVLMVRRRHSGLRSERMRGTAQNDLNNLNWWWWLFSGKAITIVALHVVITDQHQPSE